MPAVTVQSNPWLVVTSSTLVMLLGASMISGASVIHIALLEYYDRSPVLTAWLGSLFTSMFCFANIIGGTIINTFSTKTCIIVGGVLNLIGFSISGFFSNFETLFLTYGLIAGCGQAISYSGSYVIVGFYFDKLRTLSTGIIVSGFALGQIIHPMLVQLMLDYYGLNGTFILIGAMGFQTCVLGALIKPHPLEFERKAQIDPKHTFSLSYRLRNICQSILNHLKILKNLAFLLFSISVLCWSTSLGIFTLYITEYYITCGSASSEAAMLTSLIGIGSIISRLLMGIAAVDQSVDGKMLYFGSYGILGFLTIFLPLYGHYFFGKIFCSLMFGLYSGGTWSLLGPISVEIVGLYHLATAFGILNLSAGSGFVIGPISSGIILSLGGDFSGVFIYTGCMHFLASFFGMLMILYIPKPETKDDGIIHEEIPLNRHNIGSENSELVITELIKVKEVDSNRTEAQVLLSAIDDQTEDLVLLSDIRDQTKAQVLSSNTDDHTETQVLSSSTCDQTEAQVLLSAIDDHTEAQVLLSDIDDHTEAQVLLSDIDDHTETQVLLSAIDAKEPNLDQEPSETQLLLREQER